MFQNTVVDVQAGYPGGAAGGIFYPTKGEIVTGLNGVTVGNFCYKVTDQENQVVANNTAAAAGSITGGTLTNAAADFVALTTPSFTIVVDGESYTVSPDFTGNTTLTQVAASIATALSTAFGAEHTASTFTYNTTANNFVLNMGEITGDHTLNLPSTTPLSTMAKLTAATGAVLAQNSSGLQLAGLVVRQTPYATYDPAILYGVGYSNNVPAGQTAEVAVRGNWFVTVIGLLNGATNVPTGSAVYSRDTDGAVFLGTTDVAGYSKTNFLTTSPSTENIVNGLIIISNSEEVNA